MAKSPAIIIAGAEARILEPSDPFEVSCDRRGCSSNCCTKSAPIILNPYEIACICAGSGLKYEDLLDMVDTDRAKAFPLVMLPRDPACPFWTGQGCRVYSARPLACRLYPLGRVFENGASYLVHPALNICSGLSSEPSRTASDYLSSQSVNLQIEMADHWIRFVSEIEQLPLPDAPVTSVAFHMLVYSPDTPPAQGPIDPCLSVEDRFLLRLSSAAEQIPHFLKLKV